MISVVVLADNPPPEFAEDGHYQALWTLESLFRSNVGIHRSRKAIQVSLYLCRVYFAEQQSPTGPKKRIQGGDCCPRRTSLLRFPWLFPILNSSELRGLHCHSYFGPRTCGGGITNVIEVCGTVNQGFPFSPLLREV